MIHSPTIDFTPRLVQGSLPLLGTRMARFFPHGMASSLRLSCAAFVLWFVVFTFCNPLALLQDLPLRAAFRTKPHTTNATLGFQKLYSISLPQRTDRQDALTLMGALSGLDIEIAPGVRGEDVLNKTIPKVGGVRPRVLHENRLGTDLSNPSSRIPIRRT